MLGKAGPMIVCLIFDINVSPEDRFVVTVNLPGSYCKSWALWMIAMQVSLF
jgi:hypothetical protein